MFGRAILSIVCREWHAGCCCKLFAFKFRAVEVSEIQYHSVSIRSIHPSILYLGLGCRQTFLSPTSAGKILRCSQVSQETIPPVFSASSLGSCMVVHALKHPKGIQTRCLIQILMILIRLSWLFTVWRSSGSTLISSLLTKLLTPSLRELAATLWRKLISAACTRA